MNDDPTYRASAETVFKQNSALYDQCLKIQADYGRWLVTSIFAMHGSAIVGLFFKASAGPIPYLNAVCWFVAGIVIALATGFVTWINFSLNAHQFARWADHRMLNDAQYWPKGTNPWIGRTMYGAIILGMLSVACLIAGVIHVLCSFQR